ncbi:flagellar motor protein [Paenibacillus marinisediminis]
MDMTTLIGIIAGLAALIGGFLWEGGHISGLWEGTAALIVFGGTIAAVVVSYPIHRLRSIPNALRIAFKQRNNEMPKLIDDLVAMSTQARRNGVLVLEEPAQKHSNSFLRDGVMLVVDGTDPEIIKDMLDIEMDAVEYKYDGYAKIFESAGGFAPTFGIIGTVMGLIHVLSNLNDPAMLGPSIAVAFTATLYGVATANVIYLPIASKIRTRSAQHIREMEMIQCGVLAIQAGENPQIIRKKLSSFLQGEMATEPPAREANTKSAKVAPERGMKYETQK